MGLTLVVWKVSKVTVKVKNHDSRSWASVETEWECVPKLEPPSAPCCALSCPFCPGLQGVNSAASFPDPRSWGGRVELSSGSQKRSSSFSCCPWCPESFCLVHSLKGHWSGLGLNGVRDDGQKAWVVGWARALKAAWSWDHIAGPTPGATCCAGFPEESLLSLGWISSVYDLISP